MTESADGANLEDAIASSGARDTQDPLDFLVTQQAVGTPKAAPRKPARPDKRKQMLAISLGIGASFLAVIVLLIVLTGGTPQGTVQLAIKDVPSNISVSVDGSPAELEVNGSPYPLDAGHHEVSVSAPGYATKTRSFTVKAKEAALVEIQLAPLLSPVPYQPDATPAKDAVASRRPTTPAPLAPPTTPGLSANIPNWPENDPAPAIAPLQAAEARKIQQGWAAHLGLPLERECTLAGGAKIVMVLIPPGEFLMGSSPSSMARFVADAEAENDSWASDRVALEGPQHRVRITRPFYLGKYEVTQQQWQSVTGSNPSLFRGDPSLPVENVLKEDIEAFLAEADCDRRDRKTSICAAHRGPVGILLPRRIDNRLRVWRQPGRPGAARLVQDDQ